MTEPLSKIRLHLMRFLFLLTGASLAVPAWSTILSPGEFDPTRGVAYSFWAAFSILAFWGVRFPERMLPLLLLQFFYKLIWLIAVGYPLWSAGNLTPVANDLIMACGLGVIFDLLIIPWPYVFKQYVVGVFRIK